MKLKDFNQNKIRVLHNLIAYKWIKLEKLGSEKLNLYLPDNINDNSGQGRMGHRYTCEVIAIGLDVHTLKVGDRFLLHEYDKLETAVPWNVEDVMFAEEDVISILFLENAKPFTILAKHITDKMMNEFEDY